MSCASSRNISGETTLFSNLSYFVSRLPGPDGYEDCLCSRKTPLHQKNEIISLYGWPPSTGLSPPSSPPPLTQLLSSCYREDRKQTCPVRKVSYKTVDQGLNLSSKKSPWRCMQKVINSVVFLLFVLVGTNCFIACKLCVGERTPIQLDGTKSTTELLGLPGGGGVASTYL